MFKSALGTLLTLATIAFVAISCSRDQEMLAPNEEQVAFSSNANCFDDVNAFSFPITKASFDNIDPKKGKNAARPSKLSGIGSWVVPTCNDELKEAIVFSYNEGDKYAKYEGRTFKSHAGRPFVIGILIYEMADGSLHGYEVHNDKKVRGIRKQTWGTGGTAMHRTSLLSQTKKILSNKGADYDYVAMDGLDITGTVKTSKGDTEPFVISFGKVFYGRLWYGKSANPVLISKDKYDLPCDITYKDVIKESQKKFDGVNGFQAPPAGSRPLMVQVFDKSGSDYTYGGYTFRSTAGIAIFKIRNRLHGYEITKDCKLRGIRHQTWGSGATAMHRLSLLSQVKNKHVSKGWRYELDGLKGDGLDIIGKVYHKSNKKQKEQWILPFTKVFYGRMWYGKAVNYTPPPKYTIAEITCNDQIPVGTTASEKVPNNWSGISASVKQGTDLINLNNRSNAPVTFSIDYRNFGKDLSITVPAKTDLKVKGEVGATFVITSNATGSKKWQGTVNACAPKYTIAEITCNDLIPVGTTASEKVPSHWTGISASVKQNTDLINLNNRSGSPVTFSIDYRNFGKDLTITVPAKTDLKVKGEVGATFVITSNATGSKKWQGTVNSCPLSIADITCNDQIPVGTTAGQKVPENWTGISASVKQNTDLINLNNRSDSPVTFTIDYRNVGKDISITVPRKTDLKVKGASGGTFVITTDATGTKKWQGTVNRCR